MTVEQAEQLKTGDQVRLSDGKTAIYRGRSEPSKIWLEYPPTRGVLERSLACLLHPQCSLAQDSKA